jgi:hypothetical protein
MAEEARALIGLNASPRRHPGESRGPSSLATRDFFTMDSGFRRNDAEV